MSNNRNILVVEDNQDLTLYLEKFLQDQGFRTSVLHKGSLVISELEDETYDLVLLDLKLPDVKGESLCRQIKDIHPNLPVILLTAKDQVQNIVSGFNLGADDYITKPFDNEELLARIKARLKDDTQKKMTAANLELDPTTKSVIRDGEKLDLTKTEFNLLKYLLINKDQVLSRDMILSHVWGYQNDTNTRVVDVYIGYLRKKVDEEFEPKLIHSVRGFGYMLSNKQT